MTNAEKMDIKRNQVDYLYESDQFKLIRLKTHRSAVLYGYGTKWCFSADVEDPHVYDTYAHDGPIFVISDKRTRGKYTFTFEAPDGLVDELMHKVSFADLFARDPDLKLFLQHLVVNNVYKDYNETERHINMMWLDEGHDPLDAYTNRFIGVIGGPVEDDPFSEAI